MKTGLLIQDDLHFLERLYERYDYLQDFPCEFRGMCLDEAVSLGVIESDEFLGAVLGYLVEHEPLSRDHFPYLPPEANLKLCDYRHLTLVQPFPQPVFGVVMAGNQGKVTGIHGVPVVLNRVGNCQLWWGQDVGFIFEAYLEHTLKISLGYESLISQLWSVCEDYLASKGVAEIFTVTRDPMFNSDWFQEFLERRGYVPVEDRAVTVRKILG